MKLTRLTAVALAAAIAGTFVGPAVQHAFAQTPLPSDEDPLDDRSKRRLDKMEKVLRELRGIVFQGRDTGQPVVVQFADTDLQLQALNERIADLEATLQRLNAQNDNLAFDLRKTKQELADSRARADGLASRLAKLESAAAAQALEAERANEDPDEAFASAAAMLNSGDYDNAEDELAGFIRRHPDSEHAAQANYLLGQAYSVRSAHQEAAAAFVAAVRGYPKTDWAPDALAELARSLVALGRTGDACATLDTLKSKYPKAPASVTGKAASIRKKAQC